MIQAKKTAAYRIATDSSGNRIFRFYCDISGELCCVTKPIQADTENAALEIAWETEGRWAFDRCPRCGRYVSSAMFNINAERVWIVPPGRTNTLCSATTAASG